MGRLKNISKKVKIKRLSPSEVKVGSRNPMSKLIKEDVIIIKEMLEQKIPGTVIASKFNISKSTVSDIKYNRTWSSV